MASMTVSEILTLVLFFILVIPYLVTNIVVIVMCFKYAKESRHCD